MKMRQVAESLPPLDKANLNNASVALLKAAEEIGPAITAMADRTEANTQQLSEV